ncbi:hypothetical protein EV196_10563 [Mariniflexile fucanivorans]|uniref:Uncharacterized protein n=1 Tax=Mariniflexile fucanivorans TaxID=264023 RepID=A0A4R1RH71_9FLAO|nr:hypothetical protein EV196_10563 [Mariniflexile fucanivorans]
MDAGLISDKILNVLVDSLSIEELEAILTQKRSKLFPDYKPRPMTEEQRLKEHYRRLMISMGMVYPPKHKM